MRTTKTTTTRRRNTFTRQHGATFTCDCCGRTTRYTGAQSVGSKLCPQCYDLAGIENEISDGNATIEERREVITQLLTEIRAKGGNPDQSFDILISQLQAPASDECPECSRIGRGPLCKIHAAAQAIDEAGREAAQPAALAASLAACTGAVAVTVRDDRGGAATVAGAPSGYRQIAREIVTAHGDLIDWNTVARLAHELGAEWHVRRADGTTTITIFWPLTADEAAQLRGAAVRS